MENLPLPEKYEIKKTGDHQSEIIIEPLFPGYGTTIGNALRRVLLSSLSGAAVTAFKIKGATHEFSTIPGVKEDLVEIILNLKALRFKLYDVEETRVTIKAKGDKKIKAKDIKTTSEVEIMNTDADIATLTDKNAEFEIELIVKSGRGYVPVENVEKKKFELGTIAIDAVFSPVRNVNFNVENVRVGQMTNYDRLIMTIMTDGSVTPDEALRSAASILVNHFSTIQAFGETPHEKPTVKSETENTVKTAVEKEEKTETATEEDDKPKKKRGRPKKDA